MKFKVYSAEGNSVEPPVLSENLLAIILQSEVVAGTVTATRVSIGMAANAVCQCFTYVRVVGTTEWIRKASEESFAFGTANPTYGHIQKLTGLVGSTSYEYYQHIVDQQSNSLDTTVSTFTTAVAPPVTGTNIPDAGRDAYWEGQGYSLYWADTPSVDDIGMGLVEYANTDHWSNGNPIEAGLTKDFGTVPNTIQLCPKDNTPAWRVIREAGKFEALKVRGNQLGAHRQGLANVASYVISDKYYTPSVADGGLLRRPTKLGTYAGFGHLAFSQPGYTGKTSGGSTWYKGSTTLRLKLEDKTGTFALYAYTAERLEKVLRDNGDIPYYDGISKPPLTSAQGQGFTTPSTLWESLRSGWIHRELRVTPLLPRSEKNDLVEIIINGIVLRYIVTKLFSLDDMRLKGFGMLFQNFGARNDGTSDVQYVKDHKIYVKYAT